MGNYFEIIILHHTTGATTCYIIAKDFDQASRYADVLTDNYGGEVQYVGGIHVNDIENSSPGNIHIVDTDI